MKINLNKENLHHAYLLRGGENIIPSLYDFFESMDFKVVQNPDLLVKNTETFSIDDARAVKDFQLQKSSLGGKKFIIIVTKYFSHPAQHAMLKVLEEPASDVHFFVITNEISVLLPTLKSRLITIDSEEGEDETVLKDVKAFIRGEKEERLKVVANIVKRFEKEETSIPLKSYASSFLNLLEKEVSTHKDKSSFDILFLYKVKDYIHDQGSSVKNLLETLALTF